jgi:cell division protein FtsB
MNTTVNLEQLRTLGSYIKTACGFTFQNDPPDAILFGAIQYILNLEQEVRTKRLVASELSVQLDNLEQENGDFEEEITQLKDENEHLKELFDKQLNDYVDLRKELKAYKLVSELSDRFPPGLYDESEGVQYLKTILNSNVDKS